MACSSESQLRRQVYSALDQVLNERGDALWEEQMEIWAKRKQRQSIYYEKYLSERKDVSYEGLPIWGSPEAPVKVLAILDVEDVYSKMILPFLHQLKSRYGDKIAFYYFWNPQNNLLYSETAALAHWALAQQGLAWDFTFWALEDLGRGHEEEFLPWVKKQKTLDFEKFEIDRQSQEAREAISRTAALSQEWGAPNTPSLVFNGVVLVGVQSLDHYVPLVDMLLGLEKKQVQK